MKIIAIERSPQYSPSSVARDAAILQAVVEQLNQAGLSVAYYNEDALPTHLDAANSFVVSMGRHPEVLQRVAEQGGVCVNSVEGIACCRSRIRLKEALTAHQVPQPTTWVLSLPAKFDACSTALHQLSLPLWVKRAEGYSEHANDVAFVSDEAQLDVVLGTFVQRRHSKVLLSAHSEGDLIKFYGVAGTDFFRYSYATAKGSFSKFGWETQNAAPAHYAFDAKELQRALHGFAEAIGVPVYGGDAIVQHDGTWQVIDFNDWPSFATYRHEAAIAIAQRILQTIASAGHTLNNDLIP